MKVTFINNDGAGFAAEVVVRDGCTAAELFHQKLGADARAADYLIRVDRQPAKAEQELRSGQTMTVTPTKIKGA